MKKQTILRKAAKLILTPSFHYDWYKSDRCIVGAIYKVVTGESVSNDVDFVGSWGARIDEYFFDNNNLNSYFRPLLKAGFSLVELQEAENMKNLKICRKSGNFSRNYFCAKDAAKYLTAWADTLSHN